VLFRSDVGLAGIQLITNVTDNVIIYNFADPLKGGTLSTDTLTLTFDTTSMSDTDELMVLVEDGVVPSAVQYTESDDISVTPTGTLAMFRDQDGLAAPVDTNNPLPVTGTLSITQVSVEGVDDELAPAAAKPVRVGGKYNLTPPVLDDGDVASLQLTSSGELKVGPVSVSAVVPGTGATSLGKAEDAAHADGDTGVMALAVRRDTSGAIAGTSGDYIPLTTDSAGNLRTMVAGGFVAHDAADSGNPVKVGGKASAAAPTDVSADNDRVDAWYLRNGAQATVVTAAGALIGGDATNGLDVDVTRLPSLPAGTNAIGKLAANSGVDIGDVDVTSISAGTNLIGDVGVQPRTTNGLDTFMASGSDGSSILVATAQAVKTSAGKVYGYYLYNPEAAVTFVHFYNAGTGSVTVGTTNPLMTLAIPAGSAANLGVNDIGITFGTAITIAATTTAGGNTAPATGVSAVIWFK